MVKLYSEGPELTLMGYMESIVTPGTTVRNISPWGPQDEELSQYFAISSMWVFVSALIFGLEKSRTAYIMGRVATAAPGTLALGGLGLLAIEGSKAQFHSMVDEKSGVRGTGSFGVAPSLHLVHGRPWWE